MNTHKDSDGVMVCTNCQTPVLWEKSKAGKWYLVSASKNLMPAHTLYEYKYEFVVAVISRIPHFRYCEGIKRYKNQD